MTAPFFPRILGAVAFLNQETEPLTMNLQHHFLIAMPALQDPIFRRSVVYICEHNTNGAMGIIVNKPLENLKIEGILEKLKITPEPRDESIRLDKPVMLGGPLAEDRGFILHTPPSNFASSIRISDNTVMTTSRDVLETLGTDKQPSDVLVALGYASWEKGQLEQEILDNAWLTAPADLNILFKTPIADRWREAAKLIGVDILTMPGGRARLMSGTLLAFDFGTKSIGVAVGQRITGTARPLPAIKAQDGTPDWNIIERLLKEWQPDEIIVGLPLNMDGTEQPLTARARKFANRIHGRFGVEVKLHDERLSTVEARSGLFEQGGYRALNKGKVDSASAVIILESYFEQGY